MCYAGWPRRPGRRRRRGGTGRQRGGLAELISAPLGCGATLLQRHFGRAGGGRSRRGPTVGRRRCRHGDGLVPGRGLTARAWVSIADGEPAAANATPMMRWPATQQRGLVHSRTSSSASPDWLPAPAIISKPDVVRCGRDIPAAQRCSALQHLDTSYQACVVALRDALGDDDSGAAGPRVRRCPPRTSSPTPNAVAANASGRPMAGRRSLRPSARSSHCSAKDSPTKTSRRGSSSHHVRFRPTSPTSTPNSASPPAYASRRKQPATGLRMVVNRGMHLIEPIRVISWASVSAAVLRFAFHLPHRGCGQPSCRPCKSAAGALAFTYGPTPVVLEGPGSLFRSVVRTRAGRAPDGDVGGADGAGPHRQLGADPVCTAAGSAAQFRHRSLHSGAERRGTRGTDGSCGDDARRSSAQALSGLNLAPRTPRRGVCPNGHCRRRCCHSWCYRGPPRRARTSRRFREVDYRVEEDQSLRDRIVGHRGAVGRCDEHADDGTGDHATCEFVGGFVQPGR